MDFFDIATIAGFALLLAGVAHWSVPAALCVAGVSLIAFGLYGSREQAEQ